MEDYYQRIYIAGEKQDSDQIIGILAAINEGKLKNDIRFVNYFHEIPVSYAATVVTVEESSAEFLVHQHQAVVMSLEKLTILKSAHFPKDVMAHVLYVNVAKSRIVLSAFSFALVRAERRMSVRVALDAPVFARFTSAESELRGRVNDMSLTGMSLVVLKEPHIPLSEPGELNVNLPSGPIAAPATLLKVFEDKVGFRCIFEIETNRATEKSISRFILQRQVEIVKELKGHPEIDSGKTP